MSEKNPRVGSKAWFQEREFTSRKLAGIIPDMDLATDILNSFKNNELRWISGCPTPMEDYLLNIFFMSSDFAGDLSMVAGMPIGKMDGRYRKSDVFIFIPDKEKDEAVMICCERGDKGTSWIGLPNFNEREKGVGGCTSQMCYPGSPPDAPMAQTFQSLSMKIFDTMMSEKAGSLYWAAVGDGDPDDVKLIKKAIENGYGGVVGKVVEEMAGDSKQEKKKTMKR